MLVNTSITGFVLGHSQLNVIAFKKERNNKKLPTEQGNKSAKIVQSSF